MKIVATIKNEKGEEQKFQGETPSQVTRDLVQKTNLEGEKFFVRIALKRFWRKDVPLIKSKTLLPEDLPYAFHEFLKKAKCLECPLEPICDLISQLL